MTFQDITDHVRSNLDDAGVTFYSDDDLTESLEDAYADVSVLSKNIVKKTTLDFIDQPYYDFRLLGVEDFIAVTAIFNNNTNRWLIDNVSVRDYDSFRLDWELWTGQPRYWAPVNFEINTIVPYLESPSGNFDLYYIAQSPDTFQLTETPLIASDFQKLLEYYATGDLLEQAEEFIKSAEYFKEYFDGIVEYSDRVKLMARSDLLLKI